MMTLEPPLVLVSRHPDVPGLELAVNFGVFAGREATAAELDELGNALRAEVVQVAVVSEHRHELEGETEISVHQVKVQLPAGELPEDEFALGELAGRLSNVAERWARACFADRHVEIPA
jgi:hypothetical protein